MWPPERAPAALLVDFDGTIAPDDPADRLLERARELADLIAANAPVSIRLVKRLLRRTWETDLESMLQYEVDGMMACMASEDIAEGVQAFVEKRKPNWQGR